MGNCEKGIYINNSIVGHRPLMCFGGFGQPRCDHLDQCLADNGLGLKLKRRRNGRRVHEG